MRRALVCTAVAVGLTGCFLDQHKPNPPVQPVGGAIQGILALEDLKGPQSAAAFMAVFARKGTAIHAVARMVERPQNSACKVQRKPLAVTRASLISVGKLAFGTALQSSYLDVPEGADHQYSRKLSTDFPPGVYQVSAEGTSSVQAFQAYVQLPETLQDVTVNGQAFGSSSVLVRKGDPLIVTWRQPAVPNGAHVNILDVETHSATEALTLHCLGVENSFPASGGMFRWEVPKDQLTALPSAKDSAVYFIRAILKETGDANLDLQMQGLRTQYTHADLED